MQLISQELLLIVIVLHSIVVSMNNVKLILHRHNEYPLYRLYTVGHIYSFFNLQKKDEGGRLILILCLCIHNNNDGVSMHE